MLPLPPPQVVSTAAEEGQADPRPRVVLRLRDSELTRDIWPHAFELELEASARAQPIGFHSLHPSLADPA